MLRNISASRPITTCRRPEGAAWKNRRVIRAAVPLVACAALTIVACSDGAAQRTEANYCKQVNEHLTDLSAPVIDTEADINRVVGAWRAVASAAPLAIQDEWVAMVDNVVTAATVDPADPESVQDVADKARQTEPAADRVIVYTQATCGVTIGSAAAGP